METDGLYELALGITQTVTTNCKSQEESAQLLEIVNELVKCKWAIQKQRS